MNKIPEEEHSRLGLFGTQPDAIGGGKALLQLHLTDRRWQPREKHCAAVHLRHVVLDGRLVVCGGQGCDEAE